MASTSLAPLSTSETSVSHPKKNGPHPCHAQTSLGRNGAVPRNEELARSDHCPRTANPIFRRFAFGGNQMQFDRLRSVTATHNLSVAFAVLARNSAGLCQSLGSSKDTEKLF